MISSFVLTVEGKALNTQCSGGNKACESAAYATLSNPSLDCPVTFVITTNKPDVRKDSDVLRGEKFYDDVDFSGHCPHGRPVITRLPFDELERRVGR